MAMTILVTGGTGYIGGEVIEQLLARGHSVHTTVRDAAKSEPRLRARWSDAGERLKVFQADLLDDAGWKPGDDRQPFVGTKFAGCFVDHLALIEAHLRSQVLLIF